MTSFQVESFQGTSLWVHSAGVQGARALCEAVCLVCQGYSDQTVPPWGGILWRKKWGIKTYYLSDSILGDWPDPHLQMRGLVFSVFVEEETYSKWLACRAHTQNKQVKMQIYGAKLPTPCLVHQSHISQTVSRNASGPELLQGVHGKRLLWSSKCEKSVKTLLLLLLSWERTVPVGRVTPERVEKYCAKDTCLHFWKQGPGICILSKHPRYSQCVEVWGALFLVHSVYFRFLH